MTGEPRWQVILLSHHLPPPNLTSPADLTKNPNHQYTEVPGGQTVYVLPTGALTFTLAHAEGQPFENNGTVTGFSFTPGSDNALGVFSFTGLNSTGFLACPARNGTAPWYVDIHTSGASSSLPPPISRPENEQEEANADLLSLGNPHRQVFAAIKGIQNADVPGGNVSACLEFVAFGASGEELGTANTGEPAAWEYE